jgi:hypothetical protein
VRGTVFVFLFFNFLLFVTRRRDGNKGNPSFPDIYTQVSAYLSMIFSRKDKKKKRERERKRKTRIKVP